MKYLYMYLLYEMFVYVAWIGKCLYMYLVYMCAVFQELYLYKFCMYCQRQCFVDLQIKFELELCNIYLILNDKISS